MEVLSFNSFALSTLSIGHVNHLHYSLRGESPFILNVQVQLSAMALKSLITTLSQVPGLSGEWHVLEKISQGGTMKRGLRFQSWCGEFPRDLCG